MRELQNNALPQSPQENFCLVAHPLSTRFFFWTGGDGSFPGTKTTFMLGVFFLTITTRKKKIFDHIVSLKKLIALGGPPTGKVS